MKDWKRQNFLKVRGNPKLPFVKSWKRYISSVKSWKWKKSFVKSWIDPSLGGPHEYTINNQHRKLKHVIITSGHNGKKYISDRKYTSPLIMNFHHLTRQYNPSDSSSTSHHTSNSITSEQTHPHITWNQFAFLYSRKSHHPTSRRL